MRRLKSFQPFWAHTVMFWGAGATASLGMKTTDQLAQVIFRLATVHERQKVCVKERVRKQFPDVNEQVRLELAALLVLLGEEGNEKEAMSILRFSEERARELQRLYDWKVTCEVMKRCPGVFEGRFSLQDVYNLIDLHIRSGQGFVVGGRFIRPEELIVARRTLNMLISVIHAIDYYCLLSHHKEKIKPYVDFAMILGERMQREGEERVRRGISLMDREFYLFSYAVISMNWDPLFLWFLFNAHRELNERKKAPRVDRFGNRLKLFHDLAHFMAVRRIDGNDPSPWFPFNETVVQRLNDLEYNSGRRVRIGKFYFPHGCYGFRECPNCGKLTVYLGDEWNIYSKTLFPPMILPSLSSFRSRSEQEKHARQKGVFDGMQCAHCGQMTESHHTAIVMQTQLKEEYAPFLEEIQRDMKVALEHAKHIVLFGYSLPEDDFIYRTILSARKRDGSVKCSIVNFQQGLPDKWLDRQQWEKYKLSNELKSLCERVISIFGKENVRLYGAGIPAVFLHNGYASERKVQQLLEW
ncbi:hypothetical protein [Anoxybacillus sp. MB8]|uniref:hypothetical protein n=1 Tax=Anoxybacillus sp. MB8 TaxID=2496850 RepID=UPI0013D7CBF2|nr:hypothetical protein [Anoxybacillus sp. MB8]